MISDIAIHPEEAFSFEPYAPEHKASAGSSAPTSLHYALESSMKIWQPSNHVVGTFMHQDSLEATPSHLSAALDYSMMSMDFPRPRARLHRVRKEYLPSIGRATASLDESSVSSHSSGSRSTSHSPSPTPSLSGTQFGQRSSPNPSTPTDSFVSLPTSGALPEAYSRKVFVGGLPPDIDQDEIREQFSRFGPLTVDWPHKAQSKAYFPPKGYAFLLFRDEIAVHRLVDHCVSDEDKLFTFVSSVTQTNKKVQIRPWKLSESDYIMDHTQPIDPRKTIFIGGVPRPLKAVELADIFNTRYGNVCYAGIDCDPELKYPKGAGRVTFSSRVSFMSAVSCRFLQVTYGDIDKKVEVKPYVLDDQVCDECHGMHCGGRYAPYFCGNIHCLRYYCEHCWAAVHSAPGTQNHRCFIKENGDRPRAINFFPSQRASLALP